MNSLNRRQWMRRSLLASTALVFAGGGEVMSKAFDGLPASHPLLRLNFNENPYGPSKNAIFAINEALKNANRYPDNQVNDLKTMIGELNGLEASQVMIAAGSLEILSLIGQYAGLAEGEILTPWPTFPALTRFGEVCGAGIRKIPHDSQMVTDLQALKAGINNQTRVISICNPNNPTGTEVDNGQLEAFIRSVEPGILICVDEAYVEYSKLGLKGSMVRLIPELSNLVVSRTFSKAHGLAGMRIGYALSQKQNIDALKTRHIGNQISTSVASVSAAMASLKDTDFVKNCVDKNQESKEILYRAFDQWGVPYYPSFTNFVYAQSHPFDPNMVSGLKTENILISQWKGIMTGHFRVSIGTTEDMTAFVDAAAKYLV